MKLAEKVISKIANKSLKNEAVDVGKVIKDLIAAKPSSDNDAQGKISQLIRGLAFSDDEKATEFVKRLTKLIDDKNFGDLTK